MSAARRRRWANRTEDESRRGPFHGRKPKDRLPIIQWLELVCALTLTVFIIFLHAYRASRAGALWRDEVSTLGVATLPSLSQVWSSLIYDGFPFLIFGVVRLWTGISWFGSVDIGLRVLGASIGVGVLLALWLANRLLGHQVPILSLALFGFNATVIVWADSIRAYGLGALLILLVYGLLWKVVESPTPKRVMLAALVSILSVQCLYQNVFLLFATCLAGSLVCLRKRMWKRILLVFAIGAISAVSLVPYIPIITTAQRMYSAAQRLFGFAHILEVFATALGSGTDFLLWAWLICGGTSILAAAYLIISRSHGAEECVDSAIFSLTILVASTASFLLFMKATDLTTEPWYYIVLMGPIALSIEVLIELFATTIPRRIGRLVVALSLAGIAIPLAWKQAALRQTNIDIVALMLEEQASAGDFVVVNPWFDGITFQRYYRGEAPWKTVPPIHELEITRYDLLMEKMATENPLQPVFDEMKKSLSSGHRVWLVGDLALPPEGHLPPWLPPAPYGPGGWYSGEYLRAWTLQLGHFITAHASAGEETNLQIAQPVSPYENLPMRVFKGWRP